MRIISQKDDLEQWRLITSCHKCQTVFEIDSRDVETDLFKPPGTYWFDGSADGKTTRNYFVRCPMSYDIVFLDPTKIPQLLKQSLIKE